MADLFDTGRPTGAMGGYEAAEETSRRREAEDLEFNTKQAEFHDWLDAEDYRKESRKTGVAQAKAARQTLPYETDATIEKAKTTSESMKAERELLGPRKSLELDKIHNSMDEMRYDQVTRAYKVFEEGVAAGRDPRELYKMAYKELINTQDPVKAAKWLTSQGITAEPTEEAINKMAALSSYGLHDANLTRQEHLLEREWELRRQVELAKARASGPEDMRAKFPDANEVKHVGNMLSGYIKDFDDFQGGIDDKGNYTGERGKIVSTISNWSTLAQQNQILGDQYVTPVDYQRIGADIINYAREDLSNEGWFFGSNNTGDTFHGAEFMNSADAAMGILETERMAHVAATGQDIKIYDLWKAKSMQIMARLKQSNRMLADQGHVPPGQQAQQTTPATGTNAGTAAQAAGQPDQQTQAPPKNTAQKMSRRQEINNEISGMSSSEKFTFTDQGKQKTPRYQQLLDERRSLQDTEILGL